MGDASDHNEELSYEDEEVAIAPPVVHNEPLGVYIPAAGADSPEWPAASPSPAASEVSGKGRVAIEIPLDENMMPLSVRNRQLIITQTTRRSRLRLCKYLRPDHCWG